MRLKGIIAEWLYYIDAERSPAIAFNEQDSNVRDYYHRMAVGKLPQLTRGYFGAKFERLIAGAIQDVLNTHGEITKDNKGSVAKRIARQAVRCFEPSKGGEVMKCLDCGFNIVDDEMDSHEGHDVVEGFFEDLLLPFLQLLGEALSCGEMPVEPVSFGGALYNPKEVKGWQ